MIRFVSALTAIGLCLACWSLASVSVRAATSQLKVGQSCTDVAAKVTFTWDGNNPSALQQAIDLSESDNGWQPGTYISAGPLQASDRAYTWPGLMPATQHYVRIDELEADGTWDYSPTFSFVSCGTPIVLAQLPAGLPKCQNIIPSLSPGDLRILAPAPGTPPELAGYLGAWQSATNPGNGALIVYSISSSKAKVITMNTREDILDLPIYDVVGGTLVRAQHTLTLTPDRGSLVSTTAVPVGANGIFLGGSSRLVRCQP